MKSFASPLRTAIAVLAFALSSTVFAADLPAKFDPSRDAAKDVAAATAQAKAQGKRVIVDVGGEWCSWCHILDRFVNDNADVKSIVESEYVWVKVNWSPQNKNEALLSRWPRITGYPHLMVLDADGKLLQSQNTGLLEADKTYDKEKMLAFLRRYAAK
ncbi:thioredoxin family protein [Caenimonas aquaedulcis]|uniref:Thioredoxin family protein n=1 Tax=Caenimonas aquaedulcis TaxID=2793270 RepID=A0A931H0Z0_9BURK|nr:thioredoxin family protein [Caenimonas aquaedulcis]MBG9386528.1 thioredoxin family protein [Caenimonas aquaedulcis]